MRLVYWKADKNYENALADLLVPGAAAAGIDLVVRPTEDYREPKHDGSLIFGVTKREILWDHQAKGMPLLYLDKGYCRDRIPLHGGSVPGWWRMCWNDVHPTKYLMAKRRSSDRWDRLPLQLCEREQPRPGAHVVILGSSGKFHLTMRIEDPTTWARFVRDGIMAHTKRPIIYRPKPSWKYAEPISGMVFDWGSKTPVTNALAGAHCTVTYGSIASVDSIMAGVPCIVLGNAVAAPVSGKYLYEVASPWWPSRPEREQWAANLAYCNFSPAEIGDGTAWKILKEQLDAF